MFWKKNCSINNETKLKGLKKKMDKNWSFNLN